VSILGEYGDDPRAVTLAISVFSAPGEIRTPNLLIRSQMLYPLSYGRLFTYGLGD
jgi:hypothetical protein